MELGSVTLGAADRTAAVAAVKAVLRVTQIEEDALVGAFAETALGLAERFVGRVAIAREGDAGLAAGWDLLPAPFRQGVAMLAAHLFDDREGARPVPVAVTALWRPYRVLRVAASPQGVSA